MDNFDYLRFRNYPSGDKGTRTLDPLLARQVLSHLSYTPVGIWQPPTFPRRLQRSIIGRISLNHRVRDENGCFPYTHRHQKYLIMFTILLQVRSCKSCLKLNSLTRLSFESILHIHLILCSFSYESKLSTFILTISSVHSLIVSNIDD